MHDEEDAGFPPLTDLGTQTQIEQTQIEEDPETQEEEDNVFNLNPNYPSI
jgi:hypothetical protein